MTFTQRLMRSLKRFLTASTGSRHKYGNRALEMEGLSRLSLSGAIQLWPETSKKDRIFSSTVRLR